VIDLHCHILPGIDDGPDEMAGSVELAEAMAASGVHTVATTPHIHPNFPDVNPAELGDRVAALQAAAPSVQFVRAGEVDVYWASAASDDALREVSYGGAGTDLLIETPYGALPPVFEDALFRITARGFRVLLAHPERCPDFRSHPARLRALVSRGALLQVTAAALVGRVPRSGMRRFAADLVRERVAHVIASDAHRTGSGRALVPEGVAAASAFAPGYAEWMATDAPAAILAGEPLPTPPSGGTRRRGFISRRRFG
jgi:protein-tyrosine phosphatase